MNNTGKRIASSPADFLVQSLVNELAGVLVVALLVRLGNLPMNPSRIDREISRIFEKEDLTGPMRIPPSILYPLMSSLKDSRILEKLRNGDYQLRASYEVTALAEAIEKATHFCHQLIDFLEDVRETLSQESHRIQKDTGPSSHGQE